MYNKHLSSINHMMGFASKLLCSLSGFSCGLNFEVGASSFQVKCKLALLISEIKLD